MNYKTGNKKDDDILGKIGNLKYPDLKAQCIIRGLDFDSVVAGTFPKLGGWLFKNWDKPLDEGKLKAFDEWMDKQLKARGHKKKSPIRQFKQFSMGEQIEPREEEKPKLIKAPKPPKIKKEKDASFGIFKGTKKEATFRLTETLHKQLGHKYDNQKLVKKFTSQLISKLKAKFPDSPPSEKSVKIWMSRCLKTLTDGRTNTKETKKGRT